MIHGKVQIVSDPQQTLSLDGSSTLPPGAVRRFRLTVVEGPKAGLTWESSSDRCSVGFHPSNDLVVEDATVSRFHCEVRIADDGAHVKDLDSRNGTVVDGVRVSDAFLRAGSLVKLGRVGLRFEFSAESNRLPVSSGNAFGKLVGTSVAMRTAFALLERAAQSDVTVLLEGETGTGKGVAAEAIHRASTRASGPFLVVDCGAIPPNLLESELFGHEKGSFTGAVARRVGAFEEASGGTIFLDEIGELAQDLQPKLLRVLEAKEFRRVGGNGMNKTDVRVVAATNRDLRAEVNAGRFRSDLYFRLAVVKVTIPPLRERPDDIPITVDQILRALGAEQSQSAALRTPAHGRMLVRPLLDARLHGAGELDPAGARRALRVDGARDPRRGDHRARAAEHQRDVLLLEPMLRQLQGRFDIVQRRQIQLLNVRIDECLNMELGHQIAT